MTAKQCAASHCREGVQGAWPFAGLTAAVLVNVLWIGALGYALVRLL